MIKEVAAYQTSDKILHLNEDTAQKHQDNIIGEALDDLLQHDSRGNISHVDRHSMLVNTLKSENFKEKVRNLYDAVFFDD